MMDPPRLIPGDTTLIENIVSYLKAKGIFDEFRHECLADVDTKSSCQNLNQRVDGYASKFLATQTWNPDLNKNELRNKLRRHIDESGMLAVGADHVVEQVINPKIHTFFLPKIIEVVHQYVREQTELLHKKAESNPPAADSSDNSAPKTKSTLSDPIAEILSFTQSKAKTPATGSAVQQKHVELKKKRDEESFVKKKEDEPVVEKKNILESFEVVSKNVNSSGVSEVKSQCDKEKIKKEIKVEDHEAPQEAPKKVIKEEIKSEEKKVEDIKPQSSEFAIEENKTSLSAAAKPIVSSKKDYDKSKHKLKATDSYKVSRDAKKNKKEYSEKTPEKHHKQKSSKSSKEPSSPVKNASSSKAVAKEEKSGHISKSKGSDSSSSKTSDSSHKKSKFYNSDSKHKKHSVKSDKLKVPKVADSVKEANHHTDKGMKAGQYSSSQDSSQGSDQERSFDIEKQKHFSKHMRKESSQKQSSISTKSSSNKKQFDESFLKKQHKIEKSSRTEKLKDVTTSTEIAKISSRSNSFGSASSVSSSSNASKDNSLSNSDEASENSNRDKKKKQAKEPCHLPNTLPPPPPPPPPSSSLTCELTSSAEMSSMEETQSSYDSEEMSSGECSEDAFSDPEADANISLLNELEKKYMSNASVSENDIYDIFLYSSSSSDFEGYGTSPEKVNPETIDTNLSVSSVHTSDLSSYDDELSDEDFTFGGQTESVSRKRLTLKKAQELIQDRAVLHHHQCKKENSQDELTDASNKSSEQRTSLSSSEDESPSEPKRSLRRERKLNPRYASNEYTSIFSSKKETFITKQVSPLKRIQSPSSASTIESKQKRRSTTERSPEKEETSTKRILENDSVQKILEEHELKKELENSQVQKIVTKSVENSEIKGSPEDYKAENISVKIEIEEEETELKKFSEDLEIYKEANIEEISKIIKCDKASQIEKENKYKKGNDSLPLSDEMETTMDDEQLFKENNKTVMLADHLKVQLNLKPQSNSQFNANSHPIKRKLKLVDSPPSKRPCRRSSVDSSSSEPATNENKPFNSETQNSLDDKVLRVHDLKSSDVTETVKGELFCKQRTNNNGDILLLNSHGKTSEKIAKESSSSKELSAL